MPHNMTTKPYRRFPVYSDKTATKNGPKNEEDLSVMA